MAVCCGNGNNHSDYIKDGEYLDQLIDDWLLKDCPVLSRM